MPARNITEQISVATEEKWASYNSKMTALFSERDTYPVDSHKRTASSREYLPSGYPKADSTMTKGEIIENILKEMRSASTHQRRRPKEEDAEEQDVINHLEKLLLDAQPDTDILTCNDFIHLNVECCTQCHFYMFPYDMSKITRLRSGQYAWVCCAIGSAIKRSYGGEVQVKRPSPEQQAKSASYKPFADFFGGKIEDDDDE